MSQNNNNKEEKGTSINLGGVMGINIGPDGMAQITGPVGQLLAQFQQEINILLQEVDFLKGTISAIYDSMKYKDQQLRKKIIKLRKRIHKNEVKE